MNEFTKRLTTIISGTEKFEIMKDNQGKYWAVNHRFIDSTGKLSRNLDGISGMLSDTFEECVEKAIRQGQLKEWTDRNPSATDMEMLQFLVSISH